MKAAVIYENGDPGVLRYEEVPDPECPDGFVIVDAEAISIEGGDLLARAGGQLVVRRNVRSMSYSFRIVDTRTGKQLGSSPSLASPHEAGRMACDAYTVLIGRDGHDPAHLALDGIVTEDGETRPFTDTEQAAMVSALNQFMAGRK